MIPISSNCGFFWRAASLSLPKSMYCLVQHSRSFAGGVKTMLETDGLINSLKIKSSDLWNDRLKSPATIIVSSAGLLLIHSISSLYWAFCVSQSLWVSGSTSLSRHPAFMCTDRIRVWTPPRVSAKPTPPRILCSQPHSSVCVTASESTWNTSSTSNPRLWAIAV